jgi:hypothetical protein
VLQHYTPVESDYQLIKTVEDEPEFDVKKVQTKLRRYVGLGDTIFSVTYAAPESVQKTKAD